MNKLITKRLDILERKHKRIKIMFFSNYTDEEMKTEEMKHDPETRLVNFITVS